MTQVQLTLIAPAHNEQENVEPLLREISEVFTPTGMTFETIIIDDGSTDQTVARLEELGKQYPWLRVFSVTNTPQGKGLGPSAAFYAGIQQAQGEMIAFLDADLQNDPHDIPDMIRHLQENGIDLIQGDRSANRRDTFVRRWSSLVGRKFRGWVLKDDIRDSACALRLMRREVAGALPLHLKGMHRFIAFYARMIGYKVESMAVHHRPRTAGKAKFGVWNRALPGFIDLLAVRWMMSRRRDPQTEDALASDHRQT